MKTKIALVILSLTAVACTNGKVNPADICSKAVTACNLADQICGTNQLLVKQQADRSLDINVQTVCSDEAQVCGEARVLCVGVATPTPSPIVSTAYPNKH